MYSIATKEAEKAAEIDIVDVCALCSFGRLFFYGSENSVKTAIQAATCAIEAVDGRTE